MRSILMALLLSVWLCCPATAQITLVGPEGTVEVREPVDIAVNGISNADLIHATVDFRPKDSVRVRPIMLWGGGTLVPVIEFYTKKEGTYSLWIIGPAVSVKGYDYSIIDFVVGEGDEDEDEDDGDKDDEDKDDENDEDKDDEDEDDGDDDAVPPGKRSVMIIEETNTRTPAEAIVLFELGIYLDGKGHKWRTVDKDSKDADTNRTPDWLTELLNLVDANELDYPVAVVSVPKEGGGFKVIGVEELPSNPDEAIEVIQNYGG